MLYQSTLNLNSEQISEAVAKGADLLQRGWADFSKWSRAMVYEFGEPIRPHLDELWGAARDEWQRRVNAAPPLPSGNPPLPLSAQPRLHQCLALIAWLALAAAWVWWDVGTIRTALPGAADSAKTTQTSPSAPPKTWTFEEASETGAPDDPTDLQSRAEKGNSEAQISLGEVYYLAKNYTEAVKWYGKAAVQGNDAAQYILGLCYNLGDGVRQDDREAVRWFRHAAEQGHAGAQSALGVCYEVGHGVSHDYEEAAKWYRKAAEQGVAIAQFNLAGCYKGGQGVPKNDEEAAKWYRKAADQGDASAQYNLGGCYYKGHGVLKNHTEAVKWYRKAAEQGDAEAQYNLGVCYSGGGRVPQNDIEAYAWFSLAAAHQVEGAAASRDWVSRRMGRWEIVEGQRRAAAFVARTERAASKPDSFPPDPPTIERKSSVGTGFFVSDDGYLVTCEHVVRGATSFHVRTPGGSLPAKLIRQDRTLDVAVLKVAGTFRSIPLAQESRMKLGDSVFTVGFPNPDVQGVEPKLTRGDISSLAGMRDNPSNYQISVPVQPGNSGGALVDESGNVVGVVTARLDDLTTYEISGALPQNVNYAVKSALVYDFLKKVPGLSAKLKAPRKSIDREAANTAAERAAVLVVAE